MGRRTVLLVAAVLVAAVGTLLVSLYAHNVNQHALAREAPQKILVAKKVIPAGTTGAAANQDGDLQLMSVASDAIAAGALSDITPVANEVALAPIYPGEQVLRAKFGKAGASSTLSIPDAGTIAISVSLGTTAAVNDFIVPGSRVEVFLTVKGVTQVLLPDAQVIAIGNRTLVPSSGQNVTQAPSDVVTFGVTQADALKLISAQAAGTLYLGLRNSNSEPAAASSTTDTTASS